VTQNYIFFYHETVSVDVLLHINMKITLPIKEHNTCPCEYLWIIGKQKAKISPSLQIKQYFEHFVDLHDIHSVSLVFFSALYSLNNSSFNHTFRYKTNEIPILMH
jgi:hypothetical protein